MNYGADDNELESRDQREDSYLDVRVDNDERAGNEHLATTSTPTYPKPQRLVKPPKRWIDEC